MKLVEDIAPPKDRPEEPSRAQEDIEVPRQLTVSDLIRRFVLLEHKIAVLDWLEAQLRPYIKDDSGEAAVTMTVRECTQPVISSEAIDEIWLHLRDLRARYAQEKDKLASAVLVVDDQEGD